MTDNARWRRMTDAQRRDVYRRAGATVPASFPAVWLAVNAGVRWQTDLTRYEVSQ